MVSYMMSLKILIIGAYRSVGNANYCRYKTRKLDILLIGHIANISITAAA
jgi:hypothetical protein